MNISRVRSYPLAICVAATLLASCAGAQPSVGTPPLQGGRAAASWLSPAAKSQNLLYVSDLGTNSVDVYPYPKGKLIGSLTGFGSVNGLCVDKAGDLFVVDESGPVQVFAHGGTTPIRELQTDGAPKGCSVDPVTGDLAVTNLSSYLYGTISIYPKAKGQGKVYEDKDVDATFFCGYDPSGNLFMDGWNRYGVTILLELPKHPREIRLIRQYKSIKTPGGVQWDGKYVALGDQENGLIYRTDGPSGKTEQTVKLHGGENVEQFWIQGSTLIGPIAQSNGAVQFWRYPDGGSPTSSLQGFTYPIAAAVSLAPKR
ncbi:MAG: hypothetical protein WA814_02980 [Candidatus Baltobacteraceae bacterium]